MATGYDWSLYANNYSGAYTSITANYVSGTAGLTYVWGGDVVQSEVAPPAAPKAHPTLAWLDERVGEICEVGEEALAA